MLAAAARQSGAHRCSRRHHEGQLVSKGTPGQSEQKRSSPEISAGAARWGGENPGRVQVAGGACGSS
eukprot:3607092-Prymnesium_polylepis.1